MNMLKQTLVVVTLLVAITSAMSQNRKDIGGGCDGCDGLFAGMPSSIGWETRIAPAGEKGDPMIITGTIFKADGKTPAPGVILYVYHTDNKGEYSPSPGQQD